MTDRAGHRLGASFNVTGRVSFPRRVFPFPVSSVLAIKVCTQHLQFKHQNGDERRKAGELQRGGRQEGGKRARLFSALPPVGCQASFGLCRSVVEGDPRSPRWVPTADLRGRAEICPFLNLICLQCSLALSLLIRSVHLTYQLCEIPLLCACFLSCFLILFRLRKFLDEGRLAKQLLWVLAQCSAPVCQRFP